MSQGCSLFEEGAESGVEGRRELGRGLGMEFEVGSLEKGLQRELEAEVVWGED